MYWRAQAPSNIALIKYMGKRDKNSNLADNPSLSYTLDHLVTTVTLEATSQKEDTWKPLAQDGNIKFNLSITAQQRYIQHLERLKTFFGYEGGFLIQSSNNFPHGSGLASSASSFAALTRCACLALSELTKTPLPSVDQQAYWSRLGSGSSCRSLYGPWALWDNERVEAIELPYQQLIHQVILINHEEKKISSSEAHQRVKSSPLYLDRQQRVRDRLELLLEALRTQSWEKAYQLCWQEFQDMHQLFHSCVQPFSYFSEETQDVLNCLEKFWEQRGDGPLITMDAGPNIHLLYRLDQQEMANQFKIDHLLGNYDVL